MKKKCKSKPRLRTYVGLLSNHVDRRDDESIEVDAKDYETAYEMIRNKMDPFRFSIRDVYEKVKQK